MARVKTHTSAVASRLIDEAGRLLASEGAAALTTRRVAALAGTSTTAVYSLFGDKSGLLRAMYVEGFRRLATAQAEVPVTDEPLRDLLETGIAYRRAALASPHLYELMFGHPVPGFHIDHAAEPVVREASEPLLAAVTRCLDEGLIAYPTPADHPLDHPAKAITEHLWAVAHGLVSLELRGWLAGPDDVIARRYAEALAVTGVGYLTGR